MEGFFMRTKLWGSIVAVLGSFAASVGAANAADLDAKPIYKAAPVMVSDWAGFYLGINGGGGWASNTFDFATSANGTGSGGLVGGHAGYNWQYGNAVAGVEVDFDGADLKNTDVYGFQHKTDELATARARLGYAVLPNLLAYGTAGLGFGHSEITAPRLEGDAFNQFGWAAGAGLEYKLFGPMIARVEYLHYDFGKTTVTDFDDNAKTSVDVVRGGLSYKF
jgi:outer membrane immunogenic protein